ncbi:hypothetical protein [Aureispira sp. CCB-QB1]|uniref:hypothetical protein n=1 Tax=Aureispira sp. CCB-QB1 TaxID=1313421 RepID=UPI0006979093|nr:hypothetical protein [Aureispira sp. CCB-QB1]
MKSSKSLEDYIKEAEEKKLPKELIKGLKELSQAEQKRQEKMKGPGLTKTIKKPKHKLKHKRNKKALKANPYLAKKVLEELEEKGNDLLYENPNDDRIDEIDSMMEEISGKDPSGQSYGTRNGDDYDYTYRGKLLRFSFTKGLREKLIKANKKANSGKLICPHCKKEIVLDKNGKEVWISKSKKEHRTAPPIDHHNPAWSKRLADLEKKNLPVDKMMVEGRKIYNALPLRILHKTCNSSIGDRH